MALAILHGPDAARRLLLYAPGATGTGRVFGRRVLGDKLANGSRQRHQPSTSKTTTDSPFSTETIDEIPHQFQRRDVLFRAKLRSGETQVIRYQLRPVKRGEYHFGAVNVFAASPLGLVRRRFRYGQDQMVPVYPSFLQMRQYELLAIHNRLTRSGREAHPAGGPQPGV